MARDRRARNVNPANGSPQPGQGEVQGLVALYSGGRLMEAEAQARKLVKKFPMALILFNILGAAQAGQGKFKEAAATHKRALKIKPDYPEAHYNLGYALQELGKFKEAAESYRRAIKFKPDFLEAQSNLGVALQRLGKLDEAIASYRQVIAANPDYADAHNNLGNALSELGTFDEAEESYRKALQLVPRFAEAHKNLGKALHALGKSDEAIASIDQSLELKPDNADAHNARGVALQAIGQLDEAVASYERALQIEPDNAEAYNNLGTALGAQGKHEDAVASYREALKQRHDFAAAHSNLGVALQELGRFDEAETSYRQALAIDPDLAEAHSNLGSVLLRLGSFNDAVKSCERALEIEPDNAGAHRNLGRVHFECGNMVDAAKWTQLALKLQKHSNSRSPRMADICQALAVLPADAHGPDLLSEIQELEQIQDADWTTLARLKLQYAKGSALDAAGKYEAAWNAFESANATIWTDVKEQAEEELKRAKQALADARAFDAGVLSRVSISDETQPVFIVGASRSGKSTFERLAASHEGVRPGGEFKIVSRALTRIAYEASSLGVTDFGKFPAELDASFSQAFAAELSKRARGAQFVTFTNPGIILNIGPLARAVENSVFVFLKRNAEDNILRCYQTHYANKNYYSYNQDVCREYIECYNQLIDIWAEKMPDRSMILSYEDMVSEPRIAQERLTQLVPLELPADREFAVGDDRGCARPYAGYLHTPAAG